MDTPYSGTVSPKLKIKVASVRNHEEALASQREARQVEKDAVKNAIEIAEKDCSQQWPPFKATLEKIKAKRSLAGTNLSEMRNLWNEAVKTTLTDQLNADGLHRLTDVFSGYAHSGAYRDHDPNSERLTPFFDPNSNLDRIPTIETSPFSPWFDTASRPFSGYESSGGPRFPSPDSKARITTLTTPLEKKTSEGIDRNKRGLASYVNGDRLPAVADTGADHNIISASYANARRLPVDRSARKSFKLGNCCVIQSTGTVTIDYAFAKEPSKIFKLTCHVLRHCLYDLVIGNTFLRATKTLSKHRHRLTNCLFKIPNIFRVNLLGNSRQYLQGTLANDYSAYAIPDTGAERNIIDSSYARSLGLDVRTGSKNRGHLQFADGSSQETTGQVYTSWQFESGKRIPITFEVLDNCCSNLIIGEDVLWDNDVFGEHASSIVSASEISEPSHLAPFGYRKGWHETLSGLKTRGKTPGYPSQRDMQQAEEDRRREWHHQFGFDWAKADAEEQAAEKERRDRFNAQLQHIQAAPLIPSIPTAPNPSTSLTQSKRKPKTMWRQLRNDVCSKFTR